MPVLVRHGERRTAGLGNDARCRGRTLLFLADDSFSQRLAVMICRSECPVRQECEDEVRYIEQRVGEPLFGIRAGFTARERTTWGDQDRDG
jgi:Transcription factor WhiB